MSSVKNVQTQYIQFRLEEKKYMMDINSVEEIMNLSEIVDIPDVKEHVKGITKFRNSIIPVVDIKKKLNLREDVSDKTSKIMIVKYKDENIGILIDELIGVIYETSQGKFEKGGKDTQPLTVDEVLSF